MRTSVSPRLPRSSEEKLWLAEIPSASNKIPSGPDTVIFFVERPLHDENPIPSIFTGIFSSSLSLPSICARTAADCSQRSMHHPPTATSSTSTMAAMVMYFVMRRFTGAGN